MDSSNYHVGPCSHWGDREAVCPLQAYLHCLRRLQKEEKSPLLRYLVRGFCEDPKHVPNRPQTFSKHGLIGRLEKKKKAISGLCQTARGMEGGAPTLVAGQSDDPQPKRDHHHGGGGMGDDPVHATQASYAKLEASIRCEVSKMFQGLSGRRPLPPSPPWSSAVQGLLGELPREDVAATAPTRGTRRCPHTRDSPLASSATEAGGPPNRIRIY